jgi:hypothetical protein
MGRGYGKLMGEVISLANSVKNHSNNLSPHFIQLLGLVLAHPSNVLPRYFPSIVIL